MTDAEYDLTEDARVARGLAKKAGEAYSNLSATEAGQDVIDAAWAAFEAANRLLSLTNGKLTVSVR